MSAQGRFLAPALDQARQVQQALPLVEVDFTQAATAMQEAGQGWIRQCRIAVRHIDEVHHAGLYGVLSRGQLREVCHHLQQLEALTAPPSMENLEPEGVQLYALLVLLLTRRLHLGDFLLFALEDGPHPAPRPEMLGAGWQPTVERYHAIARQTLAFLITHRRDGMHCNRHVPDHRLPVHLGWVKRGGETLLEDVLHGRSPLFLHQLFEVLLLLEAPVCRFVEYLYFVEAGTVGTSREQLRAVDALSLERAR